MRVVKEGVIPDPERMVQGTCSFCGCIIEESERAVISKIRIEMQTEIFNTCFAEYECPTCNGKIIMAVNARAVGKLVNRWEGPYHYSR